MPHHAVLIQRDRRSSSISPGPEAVPAAFDETPGHAEYFGWHGTRIHCRRLGAGIPLVLVHMVDVGASCIEWRRNTPHIAKLGYDTYAIDLPGFGLSGAPEEPPRTALYLQFLSDFLARVRSEKGEAPCAIGSGMGAAYLATLAYRQPDSVRRMILVAPGGISACKPNPLGAVAFHALRMPLVSSIAANGASRTGIMDHLKEDVYGDDGCAGVSEAEARYYVAHRPDHEAVERARMAGLLKVDLQPVIPSIRTPAMIAWGLKATCPPAADAEVWREISPCPVRMFPKSGLCPHFEEPAKFNEMVADFVGVEQIARAA